jgi:riboflavin kinase/FMN adenylyltransferase
MLLMGFVEDVIRKLGRPYQLDGVIVSGDRRGRHLGFPTANLQVMSQALIPENGVYACWATVRNQRYAAAVNIGVRPTFAGMETIPMIEVHLLDVFGKQDFYNERLSIDFITRLRSEQSFPNAQALSDQIDQDVRKTRAVLMTPEKVSI